MVASSSPVRSGFTSRNEGLDGSPRARRTPGCGPHRGGLGVVHCRSFAGTATAEKVLLYLERYDEGYALGIARVFDDLPVSMVQRPLSIGCCSP